MPTAGFVFHQGARLHYLEWAGAEPTIVLLPGYSLTAHAFEEIAAGLAPRHRVVALTPRGFGESDAPDTAPYTVATLAADLGAVLDSLRIARPVLVGHSLSGSVIARYALDHPTRVRRLILLDAFPYGAAEGADSIDALDPTPVPPFTGDTTYAAFADYLSRYRFVPWRPALEADLRARPLGPEGVRRRALTVGYIADQRATPPDLTRLQVPSLQLCAVPSVRSDYGWLAPGAPAYAKARRYVEGTLRPFNKRLCDRFARTVPRGQVAKLAGSHYLFFTNPAATIRAIRRSGT